ncbi:MAG: WD40/YVTN/BNR-like repeat-containing protein, partial [Candidatus Binataceae bacterium]
MNRHRHALALAVAALAMAGTILTLLATSGRGGTGDLAESWMHARLSGGTTTPQQRQAARAEYWASREGLQFGVPKHALSEAVSQMRAMRSGRNGSMEDVVGTSPEVTGPTWNFIGPEPITEKSNFTGTVFGGDFAATGRITSVAADSNGVIVAGAASGGVWLSTNNGTTFAQIFDDEPTQAVGAVALDTTTTPSTIYVATGEGNGSLDSLYG